jgi:hypothetical protein
MQVRVISSVERNVVDLGYSPVTVPAATAVDVLNDSTLDYGEIVYIELFNAGQGVAYFAYGRPCDPISSFNGFIVPGQSLTISVRQNVSMYSDVGTIISRTVLQRAEWLTEHQ